MNKMKLFFIKINQTLQKIPVRFRIPVAALCLFALLYGSYSYWKNHHIPTEILLHGNVDIRQVDLGFRVGGRIAEMRFEEGDLVKKGDVIAVLDKVPFQNDLDSSKAQLGQAEADLLKKKTGNRPVEIQLAESVVREREATLKNTTKTFDRQNDLVKKGASSRQSYDDAVRQKDEAQARLNNAKEALDLMKEGFRAEDIQAAQATVELAKAKVAVSQTSLDDTEIRSPSNGIIFSRIREPGAIVAPGSTVYTLALHEPVWIRAYISETELGRLKPGMEALVTTDSHTDPFKGSVGFISPQAEFTPKTVETNELRTDLVYRIRVIVDDPKGDLRQGMPVDVMLKLTEPHP